MRVRITRQPLEWFRDVVEYYRPGEVYELPPSLAEYLVMEEYAIVEMRDRNRHADADRRRTEAPRDL